MPRQILRARSKSVGALYAGQYIQWLGYMNSSNEFGDHWQALKVKERWVLFCLLGYIPITGGAVYLVVGPTSNEWVLMAFPIAWMLFTVGCWLRVMFFRCPRCAQLFHLFGFTHGRHCAHCGLSRYEKKAAQSA